MNNVAVTADYIHTNHPKLKTVILDIDYHHGNGTQDIFYETAKDKNILFMSLHQKNDDKGHFKHTGEHGMNINIPFPFINDIGNYEYYVALMNIVIPILKQYKPDVILISMGFDAVENDNIGRFKLTPKFYALMIWLLIVKCDDRCKIGLILEGGYNLNILPKCIKQTLKALIYSNNNNDKLNIAMINMIRELKPTKQRIYDETEKRIIECIQHFSKYWNLSETIVTEI